MNQNWGLVAPSMFDWSEGISLAGDVVVSVTQTPSLGDITQAFVADMGPIHLLPHERRQLARIAAIVKRDKARAKAAYLLLRKRATAMRAQLRVR